MGLFTNLFEIDIEDNQKTLGKRTPLVPPSP
jgi:hypothetical protein